jgi:hypothetical protein
MMMMTMMLVVMVVMLLILVPVATLVVRRCCDGTATEVFDLLQQRRMTRNALDRRRFVIVGKAVCRQAFKQLLGIGLGRVNAINEAVKSGNLGPPADLRYLRRAGLNVSSHRAAIVTYLSQLAESVAETLPEGLVDAKVALARSELDEQLSPEDSYGTAVLSSPSAPASSSSVPSGSRKGACQLPHTAEKYLPPGTMLEHYNVFVSTLPPRGRPSFPLFWRVWRASFGWLKFRRVRQHKECSVCVRYKLMLKATSSDALAKLALTAKYTDHLAKQWLDRAYGYWRGRGLSRLPASRVIVAMVDGMDQAKFAWPRLPATLVSKEFGHFVRPRLHVQGIIIHGHGVFIGVSHADLPKDSNACLELVAASLTRIAAAGLDLSDKTFELHGDNCGRENKNNFVLRALGAAVGGGLVEESALKCLQTGHSHEDLDQLWGQLAAYIAKETCLESIDDFVAAIQRWLSETDRPHERIRCVLRIDSVHEWCGPCITLGLRR